MAKATVIDVVSQPGAAGTVFAQVPEPQYKRTRKTAAPPAAAAPPAGGAEYVMSAQKFGANQFDNFTKWLNGYPDKRSLTVYLYRSEPAINNRLIGDSNSYIDKIADLSLVSRDALQQTHGGGKYKLIVSDGNKAGRGSQVAEALLDIDMALAAPVLNPLTLVLDDPKKNQGYIQSQIAAGVLIRDESGTVKVKTEATVQSILDEVRKQTAAAPPPPLPTGSPVGLVGQSDGTQILMGKLIDKLIAGAAASPDPGKQIEQALSLADRLHPKNGLNEKLLSTLLDRALAPPPPVAAAVVPDLFEAHERVEALLARVGAGRGGSDGGGGAIALASELVKALPMALQFFQAMRQQSAAAAPPPPASLPHPQQLAGMYPPPQFTTPGAAVPPPSDEPMMTKLLRPAFQARLMEVGQKAVSAYMRGKVDGVTFAQSLCTFESDGLEIYKVLEELGPDVILQTLTAAPQCAALLADPDAQAKLAAWVEDFLSFDHTDGDDDSGAGS